MLSMFRMRSICIRQVGMPMNEFNFDLKKENESKHFYNILKSLLDYNESSDKDYYEIHIRQSGCTETYLECEKVPYNRSYGGRFEFLEWGDDVFTELIFPDHSSEMVLKGSEDDIFNEWLEEHPSWAKTSYGTWTNEVENEEFRKPLEAQEREDG